MTDLVERLRMWPDPTCAEAADRIEMLERQVAMPTAERLEQLRELTAQAMFARLSKIPWDEAGTIAKTIYRTEARIAVDVVLNWRETRDR